MADSPILILQSGVDRWNRWRREHPDVPCSLANQDLSNGYFFETDFSQVDLSGANLSGACLIGANLSGANLTGVDLTYAYVDSANFQSANLTTADLTGTDIQKANLQQALLPGAYQQPPVARIAPDTNAIDQEKGISSGQLPTQASRKMSASQVLPPEGYRSENSSKWPVHWWPALAAVGVGAIALFVLWPTGGLNLAIVNVAGNRTGNTAETNKKAAEQNSPSVESSAVEPSVDVNMPVGRLNLVKSLVASSQVWAVTTHVRRDGHVLVLGGNQSGQIKVWDGPSGEVLQTLAEHTDTVRSLALSSVGDRLVSGSGDGIKVWQPQTGELLYSLPPEPQSPIWSVDVSPNDRTFISGDYDGNITAWDLETGEQQYRVSVGVPVWSVAIAPDGQSFVSGSSDRTIRHWDLATGQLLQKFTGHDDAVRAVAISPDGNTLASGSWDSTIKLWDLANGELKTTLNGHRDRVVSLAISPDSKTLASSSVDSTLKTWDIPSQQLTKTLDNSDNWVLTVAFDPTEDTLVSGGKDQTIKLWQ